MRGRGQAAIEYILILAVLSALVAISAGFRVSFKAAADQTMADAINFMRCTPNDGNDMQCIVKTCLDNEAEKRTGCVKP